MKTVLILCIRGYQQVISPYLPPSCRYLPTCSQYAVDALREYGALEGSWLAIKRISRCHPFHSGGFDPIPERQSSEKQLH
ncbi:MAG: membrane protein insertion efficiency factor YidD [Nitrospiraceae bacterium]|nr:membrane protein insertion efficiency factor YidD [Nitrospiraceae bacterium]